MYGKDTKSRILEALSAREGASMRELGRVAGIYHKNLYKYLEELLRLRCQVLRNGGWRRVRSDVSLWWVAMLGGEAIRFWEEVCPTRDVLAWLKLRARQRRVWFSELDRDQRNLIDLVIIVVKERVQSPYLARLIAPIVKRLLDAIGGIQALVGEIAYKMRTEGLRLAQELSRIAQSWGHKSAVQWSEDQGFIRYLTIMNLK